MTYDDDVLLDILPDDDARTSGVRRINNIPVYLILGIAALFLGVMVVVGFNRSAVKATPKGNAPTQKAGGDTLQLATGIVGGYGEGGVIKAASDRTKGKASPAPALSPDRVALSTASVPIARPDDDQMPPPLSQAASRNAAKDAAKNAAREAARISARDTKKLSDQDALSARILAAKLQQFEEAVQATTGIKMQPMRSGGGSGGVASSGRVEASAGRTSSVSGGAAFSASDRLAKLDQEMAADKAHAAATRSLVDSQISSANAGADMLAAAQNDPGAAYKARMAQLRESGTIPSSGTASAAGATASASTSAASAPMLLQTAKSKVGGSSDRWTLDSELEAPTTPYELRTGFIVPATLISGINSDLPGQIMAQVSQDVYDTPTGKYKLIPLGSRLVGEYKSDVAYGQSRLFIAWQRIIFPDGKAMDIGSMPGADAAGYAGMGDLVNNHYLRLFTSAFLLSGVTASIALSQDQGTANGAVNSKPDASSAMSEALGQQLGQLTTKLIEKNLNIAPTLEIRPGFRFNVIVVKDMTFSKPYQAFDY